MWGINNSNKDYQKLEKYKIKLKYFVKNTRNNWIAKLNDCEKYKG